MVAKANGAGRSGSKPEWISPAEFCEKFGLKRSTLQDRLTSGVISSVIWPSADPNAKRHLRMIPWAEVEKMEAQKKKALDLAKKIVKGRTGRPAGGATKSAAKRRPGRKEPSKA